MKASALVYWLLYLGILVVIYSAEARQTYIRRADYPRTGQHSLINTGVRHNRQVERHRTFLVNDKHYVGMINFINEHYHAVCAINSIKIIMFVSYGFCLVAVSAMIFAAHNSRSLYKAVESCLIVV